LARLLFAYFLLAKQEKVSRLPGRHPACPASSDTPSKAKAKAKATATATATEKYRT
jgi:hypothetical protein